jgi:uncharacterized membrane protein (UPF0182 family)
VTGDETTAVGADGQPITAGDRYQSKYQLLRLPGDDELTFALLRPYVPASRGAGNQNLLTAFMTASSDPDTYGQLRSFVLPGGSLPEGPVTASDNIQADNAVTALRRDICVGQTQCDLATPSIVPIGDSILYVQSFFVSGTDLGAPNLTRVIVSYQSASGTRIEVGKTFRDALVALFGEDVPAEIEATPLLDDPAVEGGGTPGDEPDDPPEDPGDDPAPPTTGPEGETPAQRQARLIVELEAAFRRADEAARQGDMVTYAEQVQVARGLAAELAALTASGTPTSAGGDPPEGTSTTTTTPTPTTGA